MFNANKDTQKKSALHLTGISHTSFCDQILHQKNAKLANVSPAAPPAPRSTPGYYLCASSSVIHFTQLTYRPSGKAGDKAEHPLSAQTDSQRICEGQAHPAASGGQLITKKKKKITPSALSAQIGKKKKYRILCNISQRQLWEIKFPTLLQSKAPGVGHCALYQPHHVPQATCPCLQGNHCLSTFFFSTHLSSSPAHYSHSFLLKQPHMSNISLISEQQFSTHLGLKPAISSPNGKKRLCAPELVYLL